MLCLSAIRNARASFNAVVGGFWRDIESQLRGREAEN